MKVTKSMINTAMARHFRTESSSSLRRVNGLSYIYARQTGNKKLLRAYSFAKKDAERLIKNKKK